MGGGGAELPGRRGDPRQGDDLAKRGGDDAQREGGCAAEHDLVGVDSINDISAIMPYFFGGGMDDMAKDLELTRMLAEASPVADPAARMAAYGVALKRETEQVYWIPLSTSVTVYAFSRQLNFTAYQDEMPRFYQSSWK